jgi:curved DNA-binding protein CbpA
LSDERAHIVKPVFDSAQAENARAAGTANAATASGATDADPLAEDVDLALDIRQQLLAADDPEIDHYTLLGVDTTADKNTVKRQYYKLAARFHPDKHFRKKLGSFKLRLELFFSRMTVAQETLSNEALRAEYDAYLEARRHSRRIEALMAEAAREAEQVEAKIERGVQAEEAAPLSGLRAPDAGVASAARPGAHSSARPATDASARPATDAMRPATDAMRPAAPASHPIAPSTPAPAILAQARRDAFARRLLGGRAPGPASVPPPPSSSLRAPTMTAADAMTALRRRYEERVLVAKTAEARKCVAVAEQAMAQGDVVKAANAFRVASGLLPADPEIERRSSEAQAKADALLAETYSRQAEYEEKNSNWPAAARSWIRVCQARPNDPNSHSRAAGALIKAGGDMRNASRLAQRVCELEPKNPGARILLAEAYVAAELSHNARRELDTAARLGGHPATIDALLKRLGPPT